MLRPRRRHRCGAHICAIFAAVLLLLSVTLLYSRINFFQSHSARPHRSYSQYDAVSLANNPLLDDSTDSLDHSSNSDDLIDEHDDAALNTNANSNNDNNVDDFLLGVESEEDEDDDVVSGQNDKSSSSSSSLYYFDHQNGVVRRGFNKKSIEEWEDYVSFESKLGLELGFSKEGSKAAFGSDDIPVDEKTRKKLTQVKGIEDALLLKGSKLREGWGEWFDKKSDFLRRDRMFKSNLEGVNPMNNLILQDPDMPGVTVLTRGDKLVQKAVSNEFKKVPFLVKKPLAVGDSGNIEKNENVEARRDEMKRIKRNKRKTLDSDDSKSSYSQKNDNVAIDDHGYIRKKVDDRKDLNGNGRNSEGKNVRNEFSGLVFADGRRWGYYPGLDSRLSFNNFMEAFFRKGKCSMRVFMVWNSPPWMFSVRHQRGLESVFYHHHDACVVVFSETLELNFFTSFVDDGFKVAVAMPNLDELLQDTPTHIFASVWYEWKKTKYYPTHYSELIRLAALYKYGGIYLDSDVVVLKPLSSLNCTIGLEDEQNENTLNGAVMAFRKHSPFIMECLTEFYASYDDTLLRWNGADLLTRVAKSFSSDKNLLNRRMELRLQPSFVFFPINRSNISRYFSAPATDAERTEQDFLLNKILKKSVAVHFWNGLTSSLIPEPESLVSRLINQPCIRCSDVL